MLIYFWGVTLRLLTQKHYNYLNKKKNVYWVVLGWISGKYSEREDYNGSEFVPTYEDKDGDWLLVGDVPWK